MRQYRALAALCALALPVTAMAGVFYNRPGAYVADDPHQAMANAWLVRVRPGANARFYAHRAGNGCPALTDACKTRGYLVPGDLAVAAYATGAFTVVDFTAPNGRQSEGAVESRLLERVVPPRPAAQDWLGHWQDTDERDIVISRTRDPAVVAMVGNATWGAHDPERVKRGAVNLGDFGAYVKPVGEWGGFLADLDGVGERDFRLPAIAAQTGLDTDWTRTFPAEADKTNDGHCRASFRLLGPYLLAYTPLYVCGGMNVTFTGVYRRVAPHRG